MARTRRKPPSTDEMVSALLLQLWELQGDPVPPEVAKMMSAYQIVQVARVQWDHRIPLAMGGAHHPTNLQPLSKPAHAEKTKRDVKAIAKSKRLEKEHAEFRRRMLAKAGRDDNSFEAACKRFGYRPRPKARIRSRGFPTKAERARLKERYGRRG